MSVMTNADLNKAVAAQDSDGAAPSDKVEKPLLVELKNGKLVFRQKSLFFEKMSEAMQEIVKFREMLEERLAAKESPLTAVPDEHKPVIAKLVHESDKTIQALSKHIQQELLPSLDEDEEEDGTPTILRLEAVEHAIKSVAKRVNYGLDSPVDGGKVPASWLIWRWEVLDSCRDWLPKNAREKVENRWRERQQLKSDVQTLFNSLPESEQTAIIGTKLPKTLAKAKDLSNCIPGTGVVDLHDGAMHCVPPPLPKDSCEIAVPDPENSEGNQLDSPEKKGQVRVKKHVDPEKAAKEKERQEKKAAKAEKEKKAQEAQAKSRSLMANFFGKSKTAATASPSKPTAPKEGETSSPGPTTARSDFQRTFRPFVLKKDAELAPINWFRERRRQERRKQRVASRTEGNVIVIDDEDEDKDAEPEDVEMADAQEPEAQTHRESLNHILARLPPGHNPSRRPRQPTGFKTYNPLAVRGLMSQLSEAEVAGDDTEVRRLLALLRDRRAVPAKAFSFHEDARPGYFGTFTRSSREIGPRAPFARDAVQVDYTYDSGEEWAEEDAGEADDVLDDGGEEEGADEERDSDLDSWLVDDDEVEEPGTPLEERMSSPVFPDLDLPPLNRGSGKRKVKEEKQKEKEEKSGGGKKRKVVIPLVPFSKGPEWETAVGQCAYEPFKAYRIQLFNDTPFPIDPFKFVSAPIEQQESGSGAGLSGQTANGFVIPAIPPHLAKSNPFASSSSPSASASPAGPSSSSSAAATGEKPKRSALPPKNPFPEAHMPHLLARIDALATSSLLGIVETVHRELQTHKVKKNAIEAKVREVGEKCKEKKVWIVKADIRAQYGLS